MTGIPTWTRLRAPRPQYRLPFPFAFGFGFGLPPPPLPPRGGFGLGVPPRDGLAFGFGLLAMSVLPCRISSAIPACSEIHIISRNGCTTLMSAPRIRTPRMVLTWREMHERGSACAIVVTKSARRSPAALAEPPPAAAMLR